ncbi:unnamed protein product, partial [Iphiclides podalirius]
MPLPFLRKQMNKEDVHLSKSLSWLLRHGAIKEGLALSHEGYLPVEELLQHKIFKGKYVIADIERVVANNDKQRFKLRWNTDKNILEIKANQGHTIKVDDTDLVPILEPKYKTVVHGTYFRCWPKIKVEGLSRMRRRHIHLSKGILGSNVTSGPRSNVQIYIFIDLAKALAGGLKFYESENGVILTAGNEQGLLSPIYFEKVVDAQTGELLICPNKIHISGYPSYTQPQDIEQAFSQYGNLTLDRVTEKFATLSFKNAEQAKAALQDRVILYGEFLTVKPFTNRPGNSNTNSPRKERRGKKKDIKCEDATLNDIIQPQNIDLSGTFDQQLSNIINAVRLTQEEVSARCQVYYDLEMALRQQWPGCKAVPYGSITTGLAMKCSDADCFVSVPREGRPPAHSAVRRAKAALLARPRTFGELVAIPRASTPLLKLRHLPTGTRCDVTFKTILGSQNSKLVSCLLHTDPRLVPVAVADQTRPRPLLPSVRWLQKDPVHEFIVDFWNAGFRADLGWTPPSADAAPVWDLLGGFFEFYANFAFDELIVCPYVGYPVRKQAFADAEHVPSEFERYKFNVDREHVPPLRCDTPLCIQDPIEQSHNVASSVSSKIAQNILEFFKFAAAAYARERATGCKDFLKALLLTRPKILRPRAVTEYRIVLTARELEAIEKPEWKAVVKDIVLVIFKDMLRIDLQNMVEKTTESQKERTTYDARLTKALWKRNRFSLLYNALALDLVERQKRITEEILKAEKHACKLSFRLVLTVTSEPRKVAISLNMSDGEPNQFREFGKFFSGVILTWVKALLMPHLKASAANAPVNVKDTIKIIDSNLDSSSDSDDSVSVEPRKDPRAGNGAAPKPT